MAVSTRPRQALVLATTLALALSAAACSGDSGDGDSTAGSSPECAAFDKYSGSDGTTVSIYSSIRDAEADLLEESWKSFEDCTGITIEYEGSGEFEAQLPVKVDGGNAPDIAFVPQPGLLKRFADAGKLKEASADTKAMAEANYPKEWLDYATVGGKFYGAPFGSNVKSFVWYSPKLFAEKGWKVPTTWDEMTALSDTIAAAGIKPWCAGIESGDATGWPATDWIEDVMLRDAGADVYDQWVNHTIPFNDPKVASAVDRVGKILKDPKYVNGGFGDVKSIATTSFQEGGTPILENKCTMYRMASFYANQWPEGTKVAEDGDVFAFYLPAVDPAKGKPVLGGGEFTVAFADRPEVQKVQTYLASGEAANTRAKLGNWVSANNKLEIANVGNPIDKLAVEILQDKSAVFRFDGSDLMPAAVGAGTFWKGMVDWINGKSTTEVLNQIENSWPK
ncbi:carbohydrate ABC transporter substrate-binding protein (CUT1 family) [Asanoa ferruginea]|uniref:Carbohydrate ABC transporter substrate-binding protein (CUT1 family) n=1 Tax=Asanoa ferruginea TaxID=53367 RepID=A0A3D9ZB03_9ACTN|nr:ABC transporter substrate-binding protein [Asanoa ferruginea]REF94501.1 carbohydrate ABC transporter substrate-binding protein (CUT1 family) [Asanoa ferruginea]GIF52507.1 alpha-glucoside ABC transporter substrate-binding protein [Asanoa ferruginea]